MKQVRHARELDSRPRASGPGLTPKKRLPALVSLLFAATAGAASAQGLSLPLVSVGSEVGWTLEPEDYRLFVPTAAAGRETSFEVYSPDLNIQDYARSRDRAAYYGDELYGREARLETRFRLSGPSGAPVSEAGFSSAQAHRTVALYRGALKSGAYALNVSSLGNGKNSFQLRASAGVRVEASRFVVNVRGQHGQDQLVGFLDLGASAVGKTVTLRNYDADGSRELQLTLVDPHGQRRALTVSEDRAWATDRVAVSAENVGAWKVLARVLPSTKQFSNSVAFGFGLGDAPLFVRLPGFTAPAAPEPEVVAPAPTPEPMPEAQPTPQPSVKPETKPDVKPEAAPQPPQAAPKGTLEVRSSARLCDATITLPARFTLSGQGYVSPRRLEVTAGEYALQAEALEGAGVEPVAVKVRDGQTSAASIEYHVRPALEVEPKSLELEVGQTAQLRFRASSRFAKALVARLNLALPDGLAAVGPVGRSGLIGDGKAVELTVPVRAVKPGSGRAVASLEPNCASLEVPVRVRAAARLKLEKFTDRNTVQPGERVRFTLVASNTGESAASGVRLSDAMPAGLAGAGLEEGFDLQAGQRRTFTLDATVTAKTSASLTNTAALTWRGETISSSATVNVTVPPAPAKLMLEKTVSKSVAQPGEHVEFDLIVKNTGGTPARGVRLTDPLAAGLEGHTLTEGFDLEPGGRRVFMVNTTVALDARGTITNTAVLEGAGERLTASASVRVEAALATPKPQGAIQVAAGAWLCSSRIALPQARFTLNGRDFSDTTLSLEPGQYTLEAAKLPGATVRPVPVTVQDGQTSTATLEYAVNTNLTLEPKALELRLGETATLRARVTTAFDHPVPVSLRLALPDGLVALGPVVLEGVVSGGKALELSVPVRAVKAVKNAVVRASLEPDCGLVEGAVSVVENPLPAEHRESRVIVLARTSEVPAGARLILSDRVPQGASYVSGSSRLVHDPRFTERAPGGLEDAMIGDPFVTGDRLFWVLPEEARDVQGITYRLAHEGRLTMPQDRVGAILFVPSRAASPARDALRLEPNSPLGKLLGGGELRLLEGDPGLPEAFRRAVPARDERTVGGPATSLRLSGERLTNDPADAPVLVIEALDAQGQPANDALVTLELSADPVSPDAAPEQPGYQARLERGVARVRLASLGGRVGEAVVPSGLEVAARLSNANGTVASSARFTLADFAPQLAPTDLPVSATERPWVAAGAARVQVDLGLGGAPAFTVGAGLRAFARGEIADDWLLTAAINQQASFDPSSATPWVLGGSLLPPANPFERFPVLGDGSSLGADARSSDGFYLRLERGQNYLMYGQVTPGFQGLLSGYSPNFNGAQGLYRAAGLQASGFVALVPNADQRVALRGDGTSLYRLPNTPVKAGSERVLVVSYDRDDPNLRRSSKPLTRLVDYTLDALSGTIQLSRPLSSLDANGGPQFLEVEYASESSAAPRELRAGVQGTLGGETGFSVTGTALEYRLGATPSAMFGLAANYRSERLQFGLEGAWSGPLGAGGGLGLAAQASYTADGFQSQLRYRETWPGFLEPERGAPQAGRSLNLSSTLKLSSSLSLDGNLAHGQDFTAGTASTGASVQARNDFGAFSASLGLAGSFRSGASADGFATAGLEVPLGAFKFGALQRVPFTRGTYGDTTLSLEYAPVPSFGIRLSDRLTYVPGGLKQEVSLGVRGGFSNAELLRAATGNAAVVPDAFGSTNLAATYDLVTSSGDAGRTRLNLDTTIPLGANWSAQLGGEALFQPASPASLSGSLGLLYAADGLKGGARAQYSLQPAGLKQVYSAGLVGQASADLVLSPSLEYGVLPEFVARQDGSSVRDGGRFSVAAALRGPRWSALANTSGRFGFYAPQGDALEGEIQASYQADERFFVRPGVAYKLERGVFTGQVGLGATYYLTDRFGLGAQAAYAFQPLTGTSQLAFGLEANFRVLDGLVLSGGFNFLGFGGLGSFSTAPGFYVRLDWAFDERLWNGR